MKKLKYQKNCKKCGEMVVDRNRVYCSEYCSKNRNWKKFDCVCKVCGNKFWEYQSRKGREGFYCSRKCAWIALRDKPVNVGENNGMWVGDKVSYGALHTWIRNRKTKPKLCQHCFEKPAYDLANISQEYKRDLNDYEWLCRSCHMKKDGRLKMLNINRLSKK